MIITGGDNDRKTPSVGGYVFDLSGKPIAEHDAQTGAVLREYIWLGDLMVGWADASGLYYVHGGHLGQPLAMTDGAGELVWRSDFSPFGSALPSLATKENDLRFPGQWAQAETGLNQSSGKLSFDLESIVKTKSYITTKG